MIRYGVACVLLSASACCLAADRGDAPESGAALAIGFRPAVAPSQALFDAIARKDGELFDAVFNDCDFEKIGALTTDDFEFYHDQWGQIANSSMEFVESIRKLCGRQRTGEDFRSRRELVQGSLAVFPLTGYGALESGVHRFYRLGDGGKDVLTGEAKFTHVWKNDNGQWRVARVLSYDHQEVK